MRIDARLAIPVLAAWAAVTALLASSEGVPAAMLIGRTVLIAVCAVLVAFGAFVVWWAGRRRAQNMSAAILRVTLAASLLTLALCLSIVVQAPFHVEVKPWDKDLTGEYPWFLSWATELRESLTSAAGTLPGVGGQLIPGLAVGDTTAVSESLETAMKAVSLTHITAVSGANCVIVTASIMIIGARIGLSRTWRVTCAVAALALFVVLVTPEASVVRAAVMSTVVLVTLAVGRPGAGLPLLSFATIMMLIVRPWWAIDFGFILSVSATAGLLVLARPLATSLARFMPALPAMLISIPLAAQLACQPVIILLQPQIPTYGVLANVIAGPAAPLATVTGLLACLVLPVLPPVATALLWLAWLPAQWIGQTAMVFSHLPSPSFAWLAGAPGVMLAVVSSAGVCLTLLHPHVAVRRLVGAGLAVGGATYVTIAVVSGMTFSASIPENWAVAACDVGQGDAVIFRDGANIMLIDTGRTPEPLTRCLGQLGIDHIDLLVLTHYDLDHVGGVGAVNGNVTEALVGTPQDESEERIIEALASGGATVERGEKGDGGGWGNTTWNVLWPAPGHPTMQDGNPGSITVRIQTPELSAIFLGDLGEAAQNALMLETEITAVDLVKVAHHGSSDQSAALYRKLGASVGLVSVGEENGYGHPTSKALALLADAGTAPVRTDTNGLIVVSARDHSLTVWSER